MEKLLTKMKDPKNSVIVWDNASAHRNPEMKQMVQEKGVTLHYLPSGSSNLVSTELNIGAFDGMHLILPVSSIYTLIDILLF